MAGVIVGIGADLVSIDRLEARLSSVPTLAGRLFTLREREACAGGAARAGRTGGAASVAGRFAAKEAVLKALGSALAEADRRTPDGWRYTDIEVVSATGSPPRLALHAVVKTTAAQLGVARWHLSLAHDGGRALALVVAEGQGPGRRDVPTA